MPTLGMLSLNMFHLRVFQFCPRRPHLLELTQVQWQSVPQPRRSLGMISLSSAHQHHLTTSSQNREDGALTS